MGFELNTSASKYTWAGNVVPGVKQSARYGEVLYIKPSPDGEGLGAAEAMHIARRLAEIATENGLNVDPFVIWLNGPFTAPEGATLKQGDKSMFHEGPITGTTLMALVEQADRIDLIKSRKFNKPTLKLVKNNGKEVAKEVKPKPKLSW